MTDLHRAGDQNRENRKATLVCVTLIAVLGASGGGCAPDVAEEAEIDNEAIVEHHEHGSGARPPSTRLRPGSAGPEVALLYGFLKAYGYFPNEALRSYAGWRPAVILDPTDIHAYDDLFAQAVRRYQRNHGLSETGEVDDRTLELMQAPRCGFPDNVEDIHRLPQSPAPNQFVLSGCVWSDPSNLTYHFASYTTDVSIGAQRSAVEAAMGSWDAESSLLGLSEGDEWSPIQIELRDHPSDGYPFDGRGGVLAHAFYPPDPPPCGGSFAGDIHFDDAERWSTGSFPLFTRDLQTVAVHEAGHALGLRHSSVQQAVMYSTYMWVKQTLHPDDVAGIRALYGGIE